MPDPKLTLTPVPDSEKHNSIHNTAEYTELANAEKYELLFLLRHFCSQVEAGLTYCCSPADFAPTVMWAGPPDLAAYLPLHF
jgi:hypothetical protein